MTFNDMKDDDDLIQELQIQLVSDYLPNDAEKLRVAIESGDKNNIAMIAESVTSAKLNVESVKVSSPLFQFSSPKDVVVRVTYSLNDSSGSRDKRTVYYLFKHGGTFNPWQYKYESSKIRYYFNFM